MTPAQLDKIAHRIALLECQRDRAAAQRESFDEPPGGPRAMPGTPEREAEIRAHQRRAVEVANEARVADYLDDAREWVRAVMGGS